MVKRTLNLELRQDLASHGAESGFSGFISYHRNLKIYNRHADAVFSLLEYMGETTGEGTGLQWLVSTKNAMQVYDAKTFANYALWAALEIICSIEMEWHE